MGGRAWRGCLAALVGLAGLAPAQDPRPDVVVLVLDDLPAAAAESGALAELANRGTHFLRARSAAATSRASIASLLTGLPAAAHGVLGRSGEAAVPLRPEVETLAELLGRDGYRTIGRTTGGGLVELGLGQGFDEFGNLEAGLPAADLLGDGEEPTLLWMHLHADRPADEAALGSHVAARQSFLEGALAGLSDRARPTALFVTSDHGLHRGDHGLGPGDVSLYEPALSVPLIAVLPGVEPRRVERTVCGLDLLPTVLELAGTNLPESLPGTSFLADARGELGHWGLVWSELGTGDNEFVCLTWGPDKLIANRVTRSGAVLFDLLADPGETNDLKSERGELAILLSSRMVGMEERWLEFAEGLSGPR